MRMASWQWGGRDHVGTISPDGREATPLAVADASRGVLPLIQMLARGEPLPSAAGARLPVDVITLRAPLPRPLRSIFCVGRNYHAHAKRAGRHGVPRDHAAGRPVADRVHQAGRLRGRPVRRRAAAGRGRLGADRLRIGAGGRDRPRRARHPEVARDGPRVRLHDRQRRDLARRADAPPAMGPGQELRHLLPDGPVDRHADELDGRATRVRGWVNGAAAPGRPDRRT